jgi:ABC-type amino acid transport substrate-binding protein
MAVLGNLLWDDWNASSSLFSDDKVLVGLEGDTDNSLFLNPAWGSFSAFSLDTVEGLLKEAGIKSRPIRVDVQSGDQMRSLQERNVDLNAALAMTSKRMKEVDFVGPIASAPMGLLSRAKDTKGIQNIVDLVGKSVCVQENSMAAEFMGSSMPDEVQVVKMPGFHSCIEALENADVYAVAGDTLQLSALELEKDSQLKIVPDVSLGAPSYYGIALPKGYSEDCRRLRDTLMEYVLSDKWPKDFRTRLPNTGQHETKFRPTAHDIDMFSCRSMPKP